MKTVIHKAESRGSANHGWLQSRHSFSFADYYDPRRMNFGALRVLNDDIVSESMGFGTHPHQNMEIITIPLSGALKHKDNMGNQAVIKTGDVQVMSAGTGVLHSEYNNNYNQPVKFLQIWLLPDQENVPPRYDQITLDPQDRKNQLQQVISPNSSDEGLWIHQKSWFHLADLDANTSIQYAMKGGNQQGVYAFIIKGSVEIDGQVLTGRDGIGISDVQAFDITATTDTEILLMEVPL